MFRIIPDSDDFPVSVDLYLSATVKSSVVVPLNDAPDLPKSRKSKLCWDCFVACQSLTDKFAASYAWIFESNSCHLNKSYYRMLALDKLITSFILGFFE